jgi:hypothetical protein
MPFVKAIQSWFALNPIGRVEQAYQERMLGKRRNWLTWVQRRIVDAALITAIFMALLSVVGLLLWVDISPFLEPIPLLVIFPPLVAIMVHFGLIIRALAYSSNSIAREQQQQSWDLLLLTGLDARQIVMGKWLATVRSLLPAFVQLGILRACVVIFIGVTINNPVTSTVSYYSGTPESRLIVPNLFHFTLTLGFILLVTACNLLFTAACGVSASARHHSAGIALARGIGIRLGFIVLSVGSAIGFAFLLIQPLSLGDPVMRFVGELLFSVFGAITSLLDNGATLGTTFLTSRIDEPDNRLHWYQVLAMLTLIATYLGLAWLILRGTTRHLIRQGALPPPSRTAASQRAPLESNPPSMV